MPLFKQACCGSVGSAPKTLPAHSDKSRAIALEKLYSCPLRVSHRVQEPQSFTS